MPDELEDQLLEDDDLEEDEDIDEEDDDEAGDDDEPDEGVDLKAVLARLDATERANAQLRESVARFQSLLAKVPEEGATKAQQAALDKSVDEVYDLLATLANGADEAFLDPAVKSKVDAALTSRRQAKDSASIEERIAAAVREALGQNRPQPNADQQQQIQQMTAQLEAQLVDEIESYGLDPDDFDWNEASEVLGKEGPKGLQKHIRTLIRTKLADEEKATRRQSRKANSGRSPRGGSPAPRGEEVLQGDDLDKKRAFLKSLGIAGV